MEDTLSSQTFRMAVEALGQMEIESRPLLAASEISRAKLINPLARISIKNEHKFWKVAIEATSDPMLAFHMAQKVPFGTFPLVDYIGSSCANLHQVLVFFSKYAGIVYGKWHPKIHEKDIKLIQFYLGTTGSPEQYRHSNEFGLAVILQSLRRYSGSKVPVKAVHFRHKRFGTLKEYEKFFGAKVLFGQKEDSIFFDVSLKKAPCKNADTFLLSSLLNLAEKLLHKISGKASRGTSDLVAKIKDAVENQLVQGEPEISKIAKHIGMSTRTLQRHLESDGTSLTHLVVEVRKKMASEFLKDKNANHADIAHSLGYSTVSAFNRAFKQWFNMTPSEFKKSQNL